MKPRLKPIDKALKASLKLNPPRAGSLIVTVFGDSISQHGNSVWLGSLIEALAPFGLNARQIRTAVFRLVQDDWLSCVKLGRRSFYSFTEFGQRQYEKTARRVYAAKPIEWDRQWTLVMPAFADISRRDQLKRELTWLGFGGIASGVLAHPCANQESLAETLQELGLGDSVIVLRASTEQVASREVLKRLTHQCWRLDALEQRYEDFIARFRNVPNSMERSSDVDEQQMFELQTILVHEYRRLLLKTTDLPDELLPANWSGRAAMELTARIYRVIRESSTAYLEAHLQGPEGLLAGAGPSFMQRFS